MFPKNQQRRKIFRNKCIVIHAIDHVVDDEQQDQSSKIFSMVVDRAADVVTAIDFSCAGKVCSTGTGRGAHAVCV